MSGAGHAERLQAALREKYRIERTLGEGGMASVYLAEDIKHGRKVAVKVLRPELSAVLGADRFLTEIKTTARLQHPHILPLFDSGKADEYLYYVMPYVEGETLREKLDREKQLGVEEAIRITTDIADALAYAHRHGVVHRDIKPGNILLHDGQVLLSDFGIALASAVAAEDRITESGVRLGTPRYMSPEQATGEPNLDARSDIYSLACVLHEMLAGEPVFTGSSSRVVAVKHVSVAPAPIRPLRPGVPASVEAAILKALQKSPQDRFANVAAFSKALVGERRSAALSWKAVRAHPLPIATLLSIAAAAAALLSVRGRNVPAWRDRPASVVVLPFASATTIPDDQVPAVDVAEVIGRELDTWDGVRALRPVDLVGPLMDLDLEPGPLERIDDGLSLARGVGVQAMLAITTRSIGESLVADAQLYDVRSGLPTGGSLTSERIQEPTEPEMGAVAPIVAGVLGLPEAPSSMRAIGAGTSNPDAALAYLSGLEQLYGARLEAAESQFREAIALDPTFPSAETTLAQTLFWQLMENEELSSELGPEITRLSTAGMDDLTSLSRAHRLYSTAFYAFQLGDYQRARQLYQQLRELDPQDPLTLMMTGEVELQDPWIMEAAGSEPRPRANLNNALESLLETVRVVPTFQLAYNRLLDIQSELDAALTRGLCAVFDHSHDRVLPPWQPISPSTAATSFCLGATDSLVWMSREQYGAANRAALRDGADLMLDRFVTALERWAAVSPEQPRAYEQLSDAQLLRRRRAGLAAPELLTRLGEEALRYFQRAVALRADTTDDELVRLSNLHLAAGQLGQATLLAERAYGRYQQPDVDSLRPVPPQLANALVVGGRTSSALSVASRTLQTRFVRSPVTGELISYAGAEPVIERIRVLGASGVGGDILHAELERLDRAWLIAGYSDDEVRLLRRQVRSSIAPSLLSDSAALSLWRRVDTMDDPRWDALTSIYEAPERTEDLQDELNADSSLGLRESTYAFVLGTAAAELGQHGSAIQQYSRLDSIPYSLDSFDPGWGLQVLSLALRAREYLQLGDSAEALMHLESFIEAHSPADSLSLSGLRRAEDSAQRIRASLPPTP